MREIGESKPGLGLDGIGEDGVLPNESSGDLGAVSHN
jgi:hypothetical protein